MVDIDVRLGLSPADLELREIQVKRPEEWTSLDAANDPELRVIQDKYPEDVIWSRLFRDEKTITVKKDHIVDIVRILRDDPSTNFNYLSDITAVDLLDTVPEDHPRFEIVYFLYSMGTFQRLRLKAQVDEDDPQIDTIESVFANANWGEREIWDMFGITFNNHSDLRRILMPDDWVGHPLRRDYPLGGEEVEFTHNVRDR